MPRRNRRISTYQDGKPFNSQKLLKELQKNYSSNNSNSSNKVETTNKAKDRK